MRKNNQHQIHSGQKGRDSWDKYWDAFRASEVQKATYELTARNTFELLRKYTESDSNLSMLDLGCGQGDISILIALRSDLSIIAVDISKMALNIASEKIAEYRLGERISLVRVDGYKLCFKDASFDIIFSSGYGSVASYPRMQREVYRVLKPNGVVISDFIRHHNLYNILMKPRYLLRQWKRYHNDKETRIYHFGQLGVKEHFLLSGLMLEDVRYFNTYPPMGNICSARLYMLFEDTFGWLFQRFLARVFLAKFTKVLL